MFYVSRIVRNGLYGVVDTEDNREDLMTTSEIRHAVIDIGITIKGVSLTGNRGGRVGLKAIEVYQSAGAGSRVETKAKVLYGLDIKKTGDVVSSIMVRQGVSCGTVRLSTLGTKFGAYVFKSGNVQGDVIFELDDSVEIDKRTFKDWWKFSGIVFDLRQVTNMKIVDAVLDAIDMRVNVPIDKLYMLNIRVLDGVERALYANALWILQTEFVNAKQVNAIAPYMHSITPEAQALALKRYRRKFLNAAKSEVGIRDDVMLSDLDIKHSIIADLRGKGLNGKSSFDDWKCETMKHGFISSLEYVVKTDFKTLIALQNYAMFFNAEDDIKQAYVTYCDKACDAIWKAYKTRW